MTKPISSPSPGTQTIFLFENVLTVVPLSCTHIANYSASKVAKIVVRHKIVSIRAEGYVSQQSSTPEKSKGEFFS